MDWNQLVSTVVSWLTTAGLRLLIALVILFVSFKIINVIARRIAKMEEKGKVDKTVAHVLSYIFRIGAKIVIAVSLVGYVGIDTSALAALVTSLGVGLGLAVNGALANLAGGVLLILARPFRVDDFIETQGYLGTVEDLHITYTCLRTPDYKTVYLPNGALSTSTIVNYSRKDIRRLDIVLPVPRTADFETVRKILTDVCLAHPLVHREPAPMICISAHSASSTDVLTRVWTANADYWTVNYDLMEQLKAALDAGGITIPFPQMDVHIKKD